MRIRILLLATLLLPAAAQAQYGKPDPLGSGPPALSGKPAPLGGPEEAPAAPPSGGPQGGRCAQPLASGCLAQQSSCQIACPPQWSMNPNAPAFTPTDRAGCMGQCQQRYFACMRLHGCL